MAWSIRYSPPSAPDQPSRAFGPACGWGYELHRRGLIDSRSAWYGLAAGAFLGIDYTMWTVSIFDVGAAFATVLVNVQVIAFPVLARLVQRHPDPAPFPDGHPASCCSGSRWPAGRSTAARAATSPCAARCSASPRVAYAAFLYLNRLSGRRCPGHAVTPSCLATASAAATAGLIGAFGAGIGLSHPAEGWGWLVALALCGQVLAWPLIGIFLPGGRSPSSTRSSSG